MTTDKIDTHYFQQLSALMDSELPPDQARFLWRRLEHDTELTGCWERWQLCGDVLRGQAQAPAPAGFAERIAAAIAAVEPLQPAANTAAGRSRSRLARWGGGALAASVAIIALFMVRQQVPDEASPQAARAPAVASQTPDSASSATSSDPSLQTAATVTAASVAVASLPRRQGDARRSATRSQQAARSAAAARMNPARAVASASVPVVHAIAGAPATGASRDPFSDVQIAAPAARPWPRSVLPQYSPGNGSFNADYSTDRATQAFYPFEPRLPESPPVNLPEPATR